MEISTFKKISKKDTNKEINQMFYNLYSLNEGKISIVEGY